jgi:hypothetical protein
MTKLNKMLKSQDEKTLTFVNIGVLKFKHGILVKSENESENE